MVINNSCGLLLAEIYLAAAQHSWLQGWALVYRLKCAGIRCVFKKYYSMRNPSISYCTKNSVISTPLLGFWTSGQCEQSEGSHGWLRHRSRNLQTKTSGFVATLFTAENSSSVRRYPTTSSFMVCFCPPGSLLVTTTFVCRNICVQMLRIEPRSDKNVAQR